jgi:hypothetical protein
MKEANPFGQEETLNIVETRPSKARMPANVRAVRIEPDPKDRKAKPLPDEIDTVIDRLPRDTVELIDIDYESRLPRMPRLEQQNSIRYAHIGARKLRDRAPLFRLTRLERLFLVSVSLPDLSRLRSRSLKYLRVIRGTGARLDVSAATMFLQGCAQLVTFGKVDITSLLLEACRRVDLASLPAVRGLRHLDLLAPGPLPSIHPLRGCESLESLVITATPLSKLDVGALHDMPSLKRIFLGAGDKRVAELSRQMPHVMITNGSVCFRENAALPPEQYYRETDEARARRPD